MRRTRAAYHFAVRQVKKDEEAILRERIADCMLRNDDRNFWLEIKRIRNNKVGSSRIIDGLTDAAEIAELFAHKYRELYTSVPYDTKEMQDFIADLNNSLAGRSMNADCFFHVNEIKDAVSKLNRHKREGFSDLSTDHVLNAPNDLYVHISCLFTMLILHGTAIGFVSA
jgi:hypothetical protein